MNTLRYTAIRILEVCLPEGPTGVEREAGEMVPEEEQKQKEGYVTSR